MHDDALCLHVVEKAGLGAVARAIGALGTTPHDLLTACDAVGAAIDQGSDR